MCTKGETMLAKKNLKLNWNNAPRNNIEYSENKNSVMNYELNSRKYNYSMKIYLYANKPVLVVWDRNIKQTYGMVDGRWDAYPSQVVFRVESDSIDELKEKAQNFINEKLNC
jgi:hypothetical protein